jgi:HK97 family phage major capsid protein
MNKLSTAAILAAGATIAPMPRAIAANPRADAVDPKALIEAIQTSFNEFKTQNDARLKQLEGRGEDPITAEQVNKINADLSALTKAVEKAQADAAAARLGGSGGDALTPEGKAHAGAFNAWFRKGTEPSQAMRELEIAAALTTQSDPDGGYLVPTEMESTIDRVLGTVSTVRSLAKVMSIGTSEYKKLVNMGGATSGWVGEEETRGDTSTPVLREIAINVAEIYAQPASTQTALDDSRIDVAAWLGDEVSIEFAEQEGEAFVSGNGVKKPRGFLQYPTVANASYAWGSLGYVASGHASTFVTPTSSVSPADCLIDLYYALKKGYRNGAAFLTSDLVAGRIRKFKDGQGNYLWAPPTGLDMPATLLGKPIETDDNMPDVGADAFPVAFGNFQRGYLILDRVGIRVLRDPYTSKPNVKFYTTKRVGGAVVNFEALKLLKIATS